MKNRITKLLALAATATAMSFGGTAAWANLITSSITGCAAKGVTSTAAGVQDEADTCQDPSKNLFTADGAGSFSYAVQNAANTPIGLNVTASFVTTGGVDQFILTFVSTATGPTNLNPDTVMFFGGLVSALGGDEYLAGFTDSTLAVNGVVQPNSILAGVFDIPPGETEKGVKIGDSGDWFMLDFSNTATAVPKGKTVTITSTIVKAPEPGSVALLGALLVAFGAIRVGRGRGLLGGRAS